jgi:hypothetical protein
MKQRRLPMSFALHRIAVGRDAVLNGRLRPEAETLQAA